LAVPAVPGAWELSAGEVLHSLNCSASLTTARIHESL